MKKENLECICEQLEALEEAFNSCEDAVYQIRIAIKSELKSAERTGNRKVKK